MKSKLVLEKAGERIFVLVLDSGGEAVAEITKFAKREGLRFASLTALGAFQNAVVGWFDLDAKAYHKIPIEQQCEALSLIGDVAESDEGQPSLHVHAVLGLSNGSTRGGHLLEAIVRPTLEVTIIETPAFLRRKHRPDLGIALIALA